jgi:hypothetical protein
LRPYFEDVQAIVAKKNNLRELRGKKIVDLDKLTFEHCPIVDCGVTDDRWVFMRWVCALLLSCLFHASPDVTTQPAVWCLCGVMCCS